MLNFKKFIKSLNPNPNANVNSNIVNIKSLCKKHNIINYTINDDDEF